MTNKLGSCCSCEYDGEEADGEEARKETEKEEDGEEEENREEMWPKLEALLMDQLPDMTTAEKTATVLRVV